VTVLSTFVPTVPESLDGVTHEWLTVVLAQPVASASAERVGQEYGFTGVVGRIRLHYENASADLPKSLIAKLPMALDDAASGYRAAQESDPTRMQRYFEMCAREAQFYREIGAPSAPRLYYSAVDEASRRIVLLLEDLSGGRQGDMLEGCSAEDVAAVLDAIAPFHARYWDAKAPGGFESQRLDPGAHEERYRRMLGPFLDAHGDTLPPAMRKAAEQLGTRLRSLAAALHSGRRALIHGDLHLDNLIFDLPSRPVAVLDWQIASVGPPAVDLVPLMLSLEVGDRRAHQDELLARYLRLLAEHGVRDYSIDELRVDCGRALLVLLAGTIGWLTRLNRDTLSRRERALQADALASDGRLANALSDTDVEMLLDE